MKHVVRALFVAAVAFVAFCAVFGFFALIANAAPTAVQIANGGTGTTTAPTYGNLLVGDANGNYELMSTSSLNISGGGGDDNWEIDGNGNLTPTTTISIDAPDSIFLSPEDNDTTFNGLYFNGESDPNWRFYLDSSAQGIADAYSYFFEGSGSPDTRLFCFGANDGNPCSFGISIGTGSTTIEGHLSAPTATTTGLEATGADVYFDNITSALLEAGSSHQLTAYAGTSCTNQFVRSLSALAIATCNSVSLSSDITGTLGLSNGGTNASLSGTSGIVAMNSGNTALSIPSTSYTLTSSLLTAPNASTTNLTYSTYFADGSGHLETAQRYISFKLSTSTTWTATSSTSSVYGDTAQIVMPFNGSLTSFTCPTNAGTLEIEITVNSTNFYYPASTTAGFYSPSTTFTKGQTMAVIGGNPASSPTYASCTLGAYQTS